MKRKLQFRYVNEMLVTKLILCFIVVTVHFYQLLTSKIKIVFKKYSYYLCMQDYGC